MLALAMMLSVTAEAATLREDVKTYIDEAYPNAPQMRTWLYKYAQSRQDFIMAAEKDQPNDAISSFETSMRLKDCMSTLFSKKANWATKNVDTALLNTSAQRALMLKADGMISGHHYRRFSGSSNKDAQMACRLIMHTSKSTPMIIK